VMLCVTICSVVAVEAYQTEGYNPEVPGMTGGPMRPPFWANPPPNFPMPPVSMALLPPRPPLHLDDRPPPADEDDDAQGNSDFEY
jgi:hypothetical protein